MHRSGTSLIATAGIGPIAGKSPFMHPISCCVMQIAVSGVGPSSTLHSFDVQSGKHALHPLVICWNASIGIAGAPGGLKVQSAVVTVPSAIVPSNSFALNFSISAVFSSSDMDVGAVRFGMESFFLG